MHACKLGLSQNFVTEFTPALHDGAEHLVVGPACEEDLAGVELEQGATNRPYVNAEIIGHAKNCARRLENTLS